MITPYFFLFLTPFSAASRQVDRSTFFDPCEKFLCDLLETFLGWRHEIDLDWLFLLTLVRFISTAAVRFG